MLSPGTPLPSSQPTRKNKRVVSRKRKTQETPAVTHRSSKRIFEPLRNFEHKRGTLVYLKEGVITRSGLFLSWDAKSFNGSPLFPHPFPGPYPLVIEECTETPYPFTNRTQHEFKRPLPPSQLKSEELKESDFIPLLDASETDNVLLPTLPTYICMDSLEPDLDFGLDPESSSFDILNFHHSSPHEQLHPDDHHIHQQQQQQQHHQQQQQHHQQQQPQQQQQQQHHQPQPHLVVGSVTPKPQPVQLQAIPLAQSQVRPAGPAFQVPVMPTNSLPLPMPTTARGVTPMMPMTPAVAKAINTVVTPLLAQDPLLNNLDLGILQNEMYCQALWGALQKKLETTPGMLQKALMLLLSNPQFVSM